MREQYKKEVSMYKPNTKIEAKRLRSTTFAVAKLKNQNFMERAIEYPIMPQFISHFDCTNIIFAE